MEAGDGVYGFVDIGLVDLTGVSSHEMIEDIRAFQGIKGFISKKSDVCGITHQIEMIHKIASITLNLNLLRF